ncbi:MAG: 7TM diverse intracellular signaling domain-containing protein, partial [Ketobacteraceae bacterium]|nr:7TM diverse intracellular signaling domain-containing protein [Ketobacteraceae bacterium]
DTNTYAFHLPIQKGEVKDFYFRVQSQGSLRIPIAIHSYDSFIHRVDIQKTLYGIFIGIMLAMVLYNLFLYVSFREASYLYYVLFNVFYILFHGNLNGLGLQFVWQNSPWWANQTLATGIAGTALWGALFTRNFLQTRDYTPYFHQFLNAISIAAFGMVIWSLVAGNYSSVIRPAMVLTLVTFITFLLAGIRNLMLGNRSARFFLLASFMLIVGAVGEVLSAVSLIPTNTFTNSLSIIGACFFSLCLSFALADRINLLRREKNRAQMQAQRSLRLANEHLEHANKTKDQFLATLSHELRTPMNGIIGSLDLLQQTEDARKKDEFVETATGCAANMVLMIEQLLGYSELQSGTLQLVNQPFNLRENINTLSRTFERLADHKGLRYICEVDDSVPTRVVGDQSRLNQILSLMLDNAVKFTDKGEIGMRFSLAESDDDPRKSNFHISIWDTGIGIPEKKQQQIFDYFYQTDASYDREFGGLGIGLALCKHLAALFNGEIKVSSKEGEGTRFDIVIELDIDASQPDKPTKPYTGTGAGSAASPRQILVVEDNMVNQMLLKGILKKLRYGVVTANNGQEAVDFVKDNPVDAILMDLQMPVMDGFSSTRLIREMEGCKQTPILAVTANASAEDRKRCMEVGMDDFIKKPVDIKTIEKHLSEWLS